MSDHTITHVLKTRRLTLTCYCNPTFVIRILVFSSSVVHSVCRLYMVRGMIFRILFSGFVRRVVRVSFHSILNRGSCARKLAKNLPLYSPISCASAIGASIRTALTVIFFFFGVLFHRVCGATHPYVSVVVTLPNSRAVVARLLAQWLACNLIAAGKRLIKTYFKIKNASMWILLGILTRTPQL